MDNNSILIVEDSAIFKRGQLINEEYEILEEGIELKKSNLFIPNKKFVVLSEKLSKDDEKRVRELIRLTLKNLLWNMYTKQAILIGGN